MLGSDYSVSELVIMAFEGTSLSAKTIAAIEREKITHFILFIPNYDSRVQLIALTDEIQKRVARFSTIPAIISADQEGGRVQRFRPEFTLLPNALKVGRQGSPNIAFELARIQARELFAAGVNLNFAPVCDINTNPANPVIGDRAYGDHFDIVSRMSSAVVRGHLAEGVEACAKHFPGHGDTHVDSHDALPILDTPIKTLRQREWPPFHRAMKSGCNFVMSAHLLLPHLDPKFPGTFSKTFLKTYLRKELQFQGVIISDDMEMGAVVHNFGAEEAPVLALQAGCDLLCYRHEDQTLIAIEAIKKAIQDKRLNPLELQVSIDRVRAVRKKLKLPSQTLTLSERLARIGSDENRAFVQKHF